MPYANVNGTKRSSWIDSKCLNIFHIRSAPAFRHSATASWSCFPVPLREVKEALMGWYLHRRDSTSIKCVKRTHYVNKTTHNFRLCLSTLNSFLRCWRVWNQESTPLCSKYICSPNALPDPPLVSLDVFHHWGHLDSIHSSRAQEVTTLQLHINLWTAPMQCMVTPNAEGIFFRILVRSHISSSIQILIWRAYSFAGQSSMGLRCHQLQLHFEYLVQRHLRLLRMGYTWPESASKLHNSIPTASHRKRYVVVVLPHHHRAPDLQVAGK